MIHILNLKELHPKHVSAPHHPVNHQGLLNLPLPQPMRHLRITLGRVNVVLEM